MHPWTIPILGVVALSLAIPSGAEAARLRFGPGVVLGAVAGAMFGGFRHSFRHHRRHAVHASARPRRVARWERRPVASTPRPEVSAPPPPTNPPSQPSASPEQTAAIFWPDAAADLADYVLLANGKERFWNYGYDSIVHAVFTAADSGDPQGMHGRPGAGRLSDASSQAKTPLASVDLCRDSASADALIERIERAVRPNASQRDALEQLRRALAQAIERIAAACPAAMPTTVAERLKTIQDRIWAMHDALLTIRLPFETFYNSLTDELRLRLRREELETAGLAAGASEGHGQTVIDRRAPTCAEPAAGTADPIMRAIAPAAHEQQRAGLEALRQRSAAMAQLIADSCPTDAQLDEPMARFTAAKDRLDVMLFAVMSMGPVLQQLYGPLDDNAAPAAQKQPSPDPSPPANAVFVNGTLAVPGAPANTDTVPAKFSAKNAADDKLITIGYTFKTLTDEDRRAIYQALKGQPAAAFNADVGTELPPGVELHPVPNEVAARVPQTRGYRYVVAKDRVLLVGTSRIVVGIFADANAW